MDEDKYIAEIIAETGYKPTKEQLEYLFSLDELTRQEIILNLRNGNTSYGKAQPLPELLKKYGADKNFIKTAQKEIAEWYWSNLEKIAKGSNQLTDYEMNYVFKFTQDKLEELGLTSEEVVNAFQTEEYFKTNRVFTDPELRAEFDEFLKENTGKSIFEIEDELNKVPDDASSLNKADDLANENPYIQQPNYNWLDEFAEYQQILALDRIIPTADKFLVFLPESIIKELNLNLNRLFNLTNNAYTGANRINPATRTGLYEFAYQMLQTYDIIPQLSSQLFYNEYVLDKQMLIVDKFGNYSYTETPEVKLSNEELINLVKNSSYFNLSIPELMNKNGTLKKEIVNVGDDLVHNIIQNTWVIFDNNLDAFKSTGTRSIMFDDVKKLNRLNWLGELYSFPIRNPEFKGYEVASYNDETILAATEMPFEKYIEASQLELEAAGNTYFAYDYDDNNRPARVGRNRYYGPPQINFYGRGETIFRQTAEISGVEEAIYNRPFPTVENDTRPAYPDDGPNGPTVADMQREAGTLPSPEELSGEAGSYDIDLTDPNNPVINKVELKGPTELETETQKFKDYILDKYKDYIADDPGETATFRGSLGTGRESFDMTVLGDGKYIYIDMLAIKPSMQGKNAGTNIVKEIMKFAEKYDAHVIAIPATDTVRESMLNNGGQYLPAGYVYFGENYQQAIADQIAITTTAQLEAQFDIFYDFISNLDDVQIATANLDKPTLDFINAIRSDGNVTYQSYVDDWLPKIQSDLFSIIQRASDTTNEIDVVKARNSGYFNEWSELAIKDTTTGSFAKWIVDTPTGKAYIDSLAERLMDAYVANPNLQISEQNLYDNVMKDLDDYGLLKHNVPGVKDNLQRRRALDYLSTGKTTPPTINQIGFTEITDEEKKLLHRLVTDKDLRNYLQFDFESSPYKWNSPLNFIAEEISNSAEYGHYPTQLEAVGNNRVRLYRAMNGVDAAMGIRSYQYENNYGGRTAGYGSQSYFTSNAGYAHQYAGRTNANIYAVEVKLAPSEIFNLSAPIINYPEIRNELGISARDNLRFRSLNDLLYMKHDDLTRPQAIELLKLNGYKAILNDVTGRGSGFYVDYIDNTGIVVSNSTERSGTYMNSPAFLEDEIIFIADNLFELEYKVVGSIPSNTLKPGIHTVKPEDIKEFVPENVLQETVDRIVQNASTPNNIIGGLESLHHQISEEIRNRGEFTRDVDGKPVYNYDRSFYKPDDLKEINILRQNVSELVRANKEITVDEIKKQINFTTKDQIFIETPGVWDSNGNEYIYLNQDDPSYVKQSIRLPNGQQTYKHWKVVFMDKQGMSLLDEFGNTLDTNYNSAFSILNIPDEKLSLYEKRFSPSNNLLEGKVLNPTIGASTQGVMRNDLLLNNNLEYILSKPYDNIIELGIVHVSPSHAISINDIRAGAQSNNVPIVNRNTGEVTWTRLGNDSRNKSLMVGMSASFEDDVVRYSYGGITGKARRGVPNYFKIRINPMNILTAENVGWGTWFQKFNMYEAAKAINVTPETLYKAMANTSLINVHSEGGYYAPASSRTVNNFINQFEKIIVEITGESNPTLVQKLMRGGGIDAIIDNPNINYFNFQELMLFDPNDQVNVGRALDIIDITEQEFKAMGGQYKVVEPGTPPLRTYDSIDLNINQTSLDDAYEIRLNLNQGFKEAELGALGLTGELPAFINNSIFDEETTLKILDAGERSAANLGAATGSAIDIYTFYDEVLENAKYITALAEEEYFKTLGEIKRLNTATKGTQYAGAAAQLSDDAAELLTYHTQGSSKYRAIQLLKNKIAYSVGKRGVGDVFGGGVAGALLLTYELSILSAAAIYGTSDAWANYFENIFKDISNNVLGTNFSMDKAEVDMEKLNKSFEFTEKISPGAMVAGPIIEDISIARTLYGDKTKEFMELATTDEQYLVSMPGYEYAPGYRTSGVNLYPYNPSLVGIDAQEISQGKPISRFQEWLRFPTNKIRQEKELERLEKERNQWYSNYSDTYENFNEKYDRVYEQFDERVDF